MHPGGLIMPRTPTQPVQVRLPLDVSDLLTAMAGERRESKTQVVIAALECLRARDMALRMEEGYRELAADHAARAETAAIVDAGLTAGLDAIPD
jgi:hypothetical protein